MTEQKWHLVVAEIMTVIISASPEIPQWEQILAIKDKHDLTFKQIKTAFEETTQVWTFTKT